MRLERYPKVVLIPIYNGTYFNSLFKIATKLSERSELKFIFLFGNRYPHQARHISLLIGHFDYHFSRSSDLQCFKHSRILSFLRRSREIDELFNFIEVAMQHRILKKDLRELWIKNEVVLCLLPADNRYSYAFISDFAISENTPVILCPQWFAGPEEIEKSLGHSKIYRPNFLEQFMIGLITPQYIRKVSIGDKTVKMIPLRFSEILMKWIYGCTPPNPWILHSGFADRIFVETPATYAFAKRLGFEERQLILTGSVYLDEMLVAKSTNFKKIRVLVAVAPNMFASRSYADLQFQGYEDYLTFLCNELKRFGYGDSIFSMHPSDMGENRALIQSFDFEISEEPVHLLLARSEIYLATVSATIQWAEYLGIPTVNFDFYKYNYSDYLDSPFVLGVHDKKDLIDSLKQAEQLRKINTARVERTHIEQLGEGYNSIAKMLFEIKILTDGIEE